MNNQDTSKPNGRRCNRCMHWNEDMKVRDPNDEDFSFGQCRLNPPVIVPAILAMRIERPRFGQHTDLDVHTTDVHTATCFPVTFATDGCGQFETEMPIV